MFYRRYTPPPPLSAFVNSLWYSEGFDGSHQRERILPNGESGIVFDLRERSARTVVDQDIDDLASSADAVFCGARSTCFVLQTSQQERVMGVQFRVGGAIPFLSMPAFETAGVNSSLEDIWPCRATLLREQLLSAPSLDRMFSTLEAALLAMLLRWSGGNANRLHLGVGSAIQQLHAPSRNLRIQTLAETAGLSHRRFIQLFRQQTGLSPKAFQRVRRFQQVLSRMRAITNPQWTDLALDCGYYDQAHFIHDFRDFSGTTPAEYIRVATPHLNHLPIR